MTVDPDTRIPLPGVVIVVGDPAAARRVSAMLFELGIPVAHPDPPYWEDTALQAVLADADEGRLRSLLAERSVCAWTWCAGEVDVDAVARVIACVGNARVIVLSPEPSRRQAWMAVARRAGCPVLTWIPNATVGLSDAELRQLADFVGVTDPVRRQALYAWRDLVRRHPHIEHEKTKTTGYLDRATTVMLGGWAVSDAYTDPVKLVVTHADRAVALIDADAPRPDLKARGLHPTGTCGFRLRITPQLGLSEGDEVRVRAVGDVLELFNSPVRLAPDGAARRQPPSHTLGESAQTDSEEPVELPSFPRLPKRSSPRVMWSTLRAFWLRTVRQRFGTTRTGYLWAVLEPALQIAILVFMVRGMRGRLDSTIYGEDPAYFFALGVFPFMMFSHAAERCMGAIASGSGLYNFRQVRPIDVIIVRALLEFVIYGLVFLLFLGGFAWYGIDTPIADPLQLVVPLALLLPFAIGLGLFFDVVGSFFEQARKILQLIMRALFFTSGVFFTIDALPASIRPYLIWNPILHAVDQVRGGAMPGYHSEGDLVYVAICALVSLFLGLAVYRRYLYRLI